MQRPGRSFCLLIIATFSLSAVNLRVSADELVIDRILDPNRVIEVAIEIPTKDWGELCKQNRDPMKVFGGSLDNPFTYFKGNITIDGQKITAVGIRKKGFLGSLDHRWPSLKVKFDEYVNQSPVPGLDGLTLNNNKQDSSLVSQVMAYQLFNAAGVHAPRCNYVRLTVNGDYLGIYTNVESIGKPFLERRFGNNSGNLYEGTLADFYPKAIDRLELKTNKKNHDRSKADRLAKLLAATDAPALDDVGLLIDIDNFLRFWAMEGLIGFWDGYNNNQNNFWVYENRANGKIYFMPWGADGAFMPPPGIPGFGPNLPCIFTESMLANRLYHDERIVERYRETMRWLLATVWNEAEMLKSIDRIEGLVTPHLHSRQSGAPRGMNSVRTFIRKRKETVEKELQAWPVRVAPQPRKPMYNVEIGLMRGSFSTRWSDQPPTNVSTTGSVKLQLQLDGKSVEFKQAGASVHQRRQGGFPFGFGGPAPAQPTTHIVISGVRDSEDKTLTLTLSVDPQLLAASIGEPVAVQGSFSDGQNSGNPFMPPFGGRTVAGTVKLSKGGFKADDVIDGEFDLTISEMHGGFMAPRPGGGPPGRGGPGGGPPQFGMRGPGGPMPAIALMGVKEVQEELSVTDAQRKQIQETQRGLGEQVRAAMSTMRDNFDLAEDERRERMQATGQKMEEANRNADKQIQSILDPKQRDRLKELQLQREGASVFGRPDVIEQLGLAEQQREKIRGIREASQPPGTFPFGETEDQRCKSLQEAVAILTNEQKEKWLSMTGKEFRFPNPTPPFAGPGQNETER